VVVTGVGLVCALGLGTEQVWKNLLAGEGGVGPITHFDASAFDCRIAAEVRDFDPLLWIPKKDLKKMGRFIQLAVASADFAMRMAALEITPAIADAAGVYIASGIGGFDIIQREHAKWMEGGPGRISFFHPRGHYQPGLRRDFDSLRRTRPEFRHGHGLFGVGSRHRRFLPDYRTRRCGGHDLRRHGSFDHADGHRRVCGHEGAFHAQ